MTGVSFNLTIVSRRSARADFWIVTICLFAFSLSLSGCHAWIKEEPIGSSPLRPVVSSPGGAALEVFSVRFSLEDDEINGALWDEIDEQSLPNDARRELAQHGFRVGVVSGDLPERLAKLLELTDAPTHRDNAWQQIDVRNEPLVSRQLIHVLKDSEARIQPTSTVHDKAYVMQKTGGGLGGQTLRNAQGILAVRIESNAEDGVIIEIEPELHYGQPKQTYSFKNGIGRPGFDRAKLSFEKLKTKLALAPGQVLVLTLSPDYPGGLAQYFFRENKPQGPEQKMIVLRLAQVPAFDLYEETAVEP